MGYMGPFSGRLGTAVGDMWNGKCCARSYQKIVNNPRTPEQVAHREMFKQEVQLAARMRWAVVKTMTDMARAAGMTAYNLFVKENQHAFSLGRRSEVGGQSMEVSDEFSLQVDYANLRMSMGDVPGVVAESVERTDDNVLNVSFVRGTGRGFDQVNLYVYAPELGKGYMAAPVYRRDRRVSVALPDEFADVELHAWFMVQSEDGNWSDSTHFYVDSLQEVEDLEMTDATAVPPQSATRPDGDSKASRLQAENVRNRNHTPPDGN